MPDVQANFLNPNQATSEARMSSCGACHSGAVRLQMLRSTITGTLVLPAGHEAAETGITCMVCHDPHTPNLDGSFSLRNPRSSREFFSYSTAATNSFAAQYNDKSRCAANAITCAGQAPNDTSRPPHHSPQYNLLIGDIGVQRGYVPKGLPAAHTEIEGQCAFCHMHRASPANATAANPVLSGHTFDPNNNACVDCHDSAENAEFRIKTTQADTKKRIKELKSLLDQWAQTKAPDALKTKYRLARLGVHLGRPTVESECSCLDSRTHQRGAV